MNRKFARIVIASLAVVSLAGFAAPAEAGPAVQQRSGWCC
jgi:hypothetical protein